MEVKNGIIIDGVLHELCVGICDECSLQNECDDSSEIICDIPFDKHSALCGKFIDCGTNEELFLAIAALRDDTDKYQWFTDGDLWFKCGDEVCNETIEYYLNKYGRKIHKATVNELIEHFKTKEEQ